MKEIGAALLSTAGIGMAITVAFFGYGIFTFFICEWLRIDMHDKFSVNVVIFTAWIPLMLLAVVLLYSL